MRYKMKCYYLVIIFCLSVQSTYTQETTLYNIVSGSWKAGTVHIVFFRGCLFFFCSWLALMFTEPRWKEMHMFVRMCGSSILCVHHLSTRSWLELGLPGWHQDHLVRAHQDPLRLWRRGGWEWLMGQWSDTLRSSASDPQPAPLLRCHPTKPAQWQRRLYA